MSIKATFEFISQLDIVSLTIILKFHFHYMKKSLQPNWGREFKTIFFSTSFFYSPVPAFMLRIKRQFQVLSGMKTIYQFPGCA